MNTQNKRRKKEVLVVAHDAGGAEVIAAWLKAHKRTVRSRVYAAGPAIRVCTRVGIPFLRASKSAVGMARIVKANADASYLLTATGWMTGTERNALAEAKKIGIKTVAYLDSWNNYRERFGYPRPRWQKRLPDEVWVGDSKAQMLAKRLFPKTQKIRLVANEYFKTIRARYRTLSRTAPRPSAILFMSDAVAGIEKKLEELILHLNREQKRNRIIIRLHPADKRTRYDALISRYGSMHIEKSQEKDIVNDLVRAQVVVGVETVALVVALIAGKKTISLAHVLHKPFLPFPGILHVDQARDAAHLI